MFDGDPCQSPCPAWYIALRASQPCRCSNRLCLSLAWRVIAACHAGWQWRVEREDVADCEVPEYDERDLGRAVLLPRPAPLASYGQCDGDVKWTVVKVEPLYAKAGIIGAVKPVEAVVEVRCDVEGAS